MEKMEKLRERKSMWNPQYSLGIEKIDTDHQRLFSIIHKVMELTHNEEEGKVQHACREGIKFFKNYTIQHFQREEAFMQSLNYGGYERHKKIHDDLRGRVLPALEGELEKNSYSIESVRHFLGVCVAWLGTHIKVEDLAIVNRDLGRQIRLDIEDDGDRFEHIIRALFKDTYELDVEIVSDRYTGWDFGKAVFHEMTFVTEDNRVTYVLLACDVQTVISIAGRRLEIAGNKLDTFLLSAVREVMKTLGKRISFQMGKDDEYRNGRSGVMLNTSEMGEIFNNKTVLYSTLFSTKLGHFACCVYA